MSAGRRSLVAASVALATMTACAGSPPKPSTSGTGATSPGTGELLRTGEYVSTTGSAGAERGKGTVEDARAFVRELDGELRRAWVARDRASWIALNFITTDTEAVSAQAEEAAAELVLRSVRRAARFDGLALPDDVARSLKLLRFAQSPPAPADPQRRKDLAEVSIAMSAAYGKARVCPSGVRPDDDGSGGSKRQCKTLEDLERVLAKSRSPEALLDAWKGWHDLARGLRAPYKQYVGLANEGAQALGFRDLGAQWRSGYDMDPEAMQADVERQWEALRPFYEKLHCWVRSKLGAKYGKGVVDEKAPIPAHLLGNMWGQDWSNLYDVLEPYKGQPSLDVTKKLVQKRVSPEQMVRMGERFFTSLGFDPLPKTFWERSLFVRPRDRDVVCHASAWDVQWNDDLRIKMCIEPTFGELVTIHHELGHIYYYHEYYKLPVLFQQGANDGFHEGIGDTLALSVTPAYLKTIGLLDAVSDTEKSRINRLMKMALERVAFLPFGLVIDKWRWDVFAGKLPPERWNAGFWDLKRKIQGVASPALRTEDDFDPGAKYHVASGTPYLRYFLAHVYQFQFHRALCKEAGHTGPLDACSIYGSKAAGEKLRRMLAMGASRPWPEALAAVSGERTADPGALLDYMAPLVTWLDKETKGLTCGW